MTRKRPVCQLTGDAYDDARLFVHVMASSRAIGTRGVRVRRRHL
jgi:hypothetical protein